MVADYFKETMREIILDNIDNIDKMIEELELHFDNYIDNLLDHF
jgi:hypothetical protein